MTGPQRRGPLRISPRILVRGLFLCPSCSIASKARAGRPCSIASKDRAAAGPRLNCIKGPRKKPRWPYTFMLPGLAIHVSFDSFHC